MTAGEDADSESEPADASDGTVTLDTVYDTIEELGRPVVDAAAVARVTERTQAEVTTALETLAESGELGRVTTDGVAYYPESWGALAERERLIVFPDRRQLVADQPTQFTRARLSSFAHLVDSTRTDPGTRGYLYEIRPEDIWAAPVDSLDGLLSRVQSVLPRRVSSLETWIEDQWTRANQFRLSTHPDGYTVLEADRESLMGNVARQKLDEDALRAPMSDTESWVNDDEIGAIKRTLYEAGYPVVDDRDLESGEPLDVRLTTELREYQRRWVERLLDAGAGVLTAPPGSGKTVAAIGILAEIGGETLILCPSRELVGQWREELLAHTDLTDDEIGEYHGGTKQIRPVTVATYQTAGMDRHRSLFDSREWGLITYDECLSGDTTIETQAGRRTFAELDDEYELADGWSEGFDLSVKTYDLEAGRFTFTDVTGVYKSEAPVQRIETGLDQTIKATPSHTHLVFDPEAGEITEQRGISEGDLLVRPSRSPQDTAGAAGAADASDASDASSASDSSGASASRSVGRSAAQQLREPTQAERAAATHHAGKSRGPAGVDLVEVTAVESVGCEPVYDFETATHTFLADGLLTHNCHHVPSDVFRRSSSLQGKHRLGLTASPVREDDAEEEIFTLIGPPLGTDWGALFDAGYVLEPEVEIRYVEWDDDAHDEWMAAEGRTRRQLAAQNPAKLGTIRELQATYPDARTLIFVDYLDQGERLAGELGIPFVSGETRHHVRERYFEEFRQGDRQELIVSRIADEGLDLPNAELAIVASGLGGSRRQGTQRAGRTMRPGGTAQVYVLATRGTSEEEFARRRMQHLAEKGIHVRERTGE